MRQPLVASIKRNALDDGPGIRSTVFFKGCLLDCVWCHNPECIDGRAEIVHNPARCLTCGACAEACPQHGIQAENPGEFDRSRCDRCGTCVGECPSGAREKVGTPYTVDELVGELLKDAAFFRNSGGGVTLSGGEATLHMDYAGELARRLRAEGVSVLLETCGDFPWETFERTLLPHVDAVWVDLKFIRSSDHKTHCGRGNERILENIERLAKVQGPAVLVRVPLVPDLTATELNLRGIALFLRRLSLRRVGVMVYNPLWHQKANSLGRPVRYHRTTGLSPEEREACRRALGEFELVGEL